MAAPTINLNNNDGNNRVKFEKLSHRLQGINVDILRNPNREGALQPTLITPDTGELGCFFQDELEQCKKLELSPHFYCFYKAVRPLVQSLPELIHHQDHVVELLLSTIKSSPPNELHYYFTLISVLARDLNEDLASHLHLIVKTLASMASKVAYSGDSNVNSSAPNPELTGKLFESISHVLKSQWNELSSNPDPLRQYYGGLLGSSTKFIRDFSAETFMVILRKTGKNGFQSHVRKILLALVKNCDGLLKDFEGFGGFCCPKLEQLIKSEFSLSNVSPMVGNLLDGFSSLMLHTLKGLKGSLSSKSSDKLKSILFMLLPIKQNIMVELNDLEKALESSGKQVKESGKKGKTKRKSISDRKEENVELTSSIEGFLDMFFSPVDSYCTGHFVVFSCLKVISHVHPKNFSDLWITITEEIKRLTMIYLLVFSCLEQLNRWDESKFDGFLVRVSYVVELLVYMLSHYKGRALSDQKVKRMVQDSGIIDVIMDFIDFCYSLLQVGMIRNYTGIKRIFSTSIHNLLCSLWLQFPEVTKLLKRLGHTLLLALGSVDNIGKIFSTDESLSSALFFTKRLVSELPSDTLEKYLFPSILSVFSGLIKTETSESVLGSLYSFLVLIHDPREKFSALEPTYKYGEKKTGLNDKENEFASKGLTDNDEDSWGSLEEQEQENSVSDDDDDDHDQSRNSADEMDVDEIENENEILVVKNRVNIDSLLQGCEGHFKDILSFLIQFVSDDIVGKVDSQISSQSNSYVFLLQALRWFVETDKNFLMTNKEMNMVFDKLVEDLLKFFSSSEVVLANSSNMISISVSVDFIKTCFKAESKATQNMNNSDRLNLTKQLISIFMEKPKSIFFCYTIDGMLEELTKTKKIEEHIILAVLTKEEQEKLIEVCGVNLLTPSYWLRYHILTIFSNFPITTLNDSALLTEKGKTDNEETFDLASLLLTISVLPADLRHEREFARLLGLLEVLAREGRLPGPQLHLVCGFCLGLLHVKFQPIWEPALQVLVAASKTQEGEAVLWPLLLKAISHKTAEFVENSESVIESLTPSDLLSRLKSADNGEVSLTAEIVRSEFFCYSFLETPEQVSEHAVVWPDARTDALTARLSAWEMLRRAPAITLRRSRIIVGFFLEFLLYQYYKFYEDDPERPVLSWFGLHVNSVLNPKRDDSTTLLPHDSSLLPWKNTSTETAKTLRKQLEMFLQVFSSVTSPKQLFRHQFLYVFYQELLTTPDIRLSKLALQCILTYKPQGVLPYKGALERFLDDKKVRDELVSFDWSESGSTPMEVSDPQGEDSEERSTEQSKEEFPLMLIRVLYGRLVASGKGSKSTRDQTQSRKIAVLAFLAKFNPSQLNHLIQLMLRGVLPPKLLRSTAAEGFEQDQVNLNWVIGKKDGVDYSYWLHLNAWYSKVQDLTRSLTNKSFREVAWERQIGFLHLLEHLIRVLGFSITPYVGQLHQLTLSLLAYAMEFRPGGHWAVGDGKIEEDAEDLLGEIEESKVDKEVGNVPKERDASQAVRVRTLCLLRVTDFINQYHTQYDFTKTADPFFSSVEPLLTALPSAVAGGGTNSPALLRILHSLTAHAGTIGIIAGRPNVVEVVINCVSGYQAAAGVSNEVLEILGALLNYEKGKCVIPFIELVIECFSRRFAGSAYENFSRLKLSEMNINPKGSLRLELEFLHRVAVEIHSRPEIKVSPAATSNFTTMLLGILRTYINNRKVRVQEEWVLNILKIYDKLLPRVVDVTVHVPFVVRLFGPPSHSQSLFNTSTVRKQLVTVMGSMTNHPSTQGALRLSYSAMVDITSEDAKMLGNRDFDKFMPIFQSLSGEVSQGGDEREYTWAKLLGPELQFQFRSEEVKKKGEKDRKSKGKDEITTTGDEGVKVVWGSPQQMSLCSAVVHEAIRCLYDPELVVRAAAIAALKRLVLDSLQWSGLATGNKKDPDWLDLVRSTLVPSIRRGMKQSNEVEKKGFVSLMAHVVRVFSTVPECFEEETFHQDLLPLTHEDPEQDFFENITHIQLHRRIRAMMRLRTVLLQLGDNSFVKEVTPATQDQSKDAMDVVEEGKDVGHSERYAGLKLRASSLVHFLLPLSYHFLFSTEFKKKDHLPLLQEAAAFTGALSLHLRWNHYLAVIKTVIRGLDKCAPEREKVLLTALCSVLDAFHFNVHGGKAIEWKLPEVTKGRKRLKTGDESSGEEKQLEEQDVEEEELVDEQETEYLSIAQTLVDSILPWVQVFLLKEGTDHKGNKCHTVQPMVAVALTKLIKRLRPPVVTEQQRHHLFSNLVIRVVGTLKSRDTSARDIARDCLAKMVQSFGLSSLHSVLYELQHGLKEGFQRHVANYTVRSLLSSILKDYSPDVDAPSAPMFESPTQGEFQLPDQPDFDKCINMIVEFVLDDLAGHAQDDRVSATGDETGAGGGALRSLIREAKGSKANDTLEMTARCLLFRPTYALLSPDNPGAVSSIHALATPLLQLLKTDDRLVLVGRTSEALQRLALGLAKNPSLDSKELLLYLHSTLQPFMTILIRDFNRRQQSMGKLQSTRTDQKKDSGKNSSTAAADEAAAELKDIAALDKDLPSYLLDESDDDEPLRFVNNAHLDDAKEQHKPLDRGNEVDGYKARSWLPTDLRSLREQRAVVAERIREQKERSKIQDGASAPKLTGRNRYDKGAQHKSKMGLSNAPTTDRATMAAIRYCLTLFNTCLKQNRLDSTSETIQSMARPFLPLLAKCILLPGAAAVVSLAVKCITMLLGWGIPVEQDFRAALSNRLVALVCRGGGLVSTDSDVVQASIRGLSTIFHMYNEELQDYKETVESFLKTGTGKKDIPEDIEKPVLPIEESKLRALIQLLTLSVMEVTAAFQTTVFQLIREIIQTRFLAPEVYDLITKLTEQIVLSQRKGVREAASSVVVTFILTYPLGKKRMDSHMKQLINQCGYEYEEGRVAALTALNTVAKTLPVPVLQDYAQMIFLPATLRLVNDISSKCREASAALIVTISRRVDSETFGLFQEYAMRWLTTEVHSGPLKQYDSLVRTGAQVASLLLRARADLWKRGDGLKSLVQQVQEKMMYLFNVSDERDLREVQMDVGRWVVVYQLVALCERLFIELPAAVDHAITHFTGGKIPIMVLVQEALLFPHAWVRAAATRVLSSYLRRRDVDRRSQWITSVSPEGGTVEILTVPNGLYQLARRLCALINRSRMQNDETLHATVECIVYVLRLTLKHPDLNVTAESDEADDQVEEEEEGGDDVVAGEEEMEEILDIDEEDKNVSSFSSSIVVKDLSSIEGNYDAVEDDHGDGDDDGVRNASGRGLFHWLMMRLRGIGADSRGKRRVHVMKVFLALMKTEVSNEVSDYIEQILDAAVRSTLSIANFEKNAENDAKQGQVNPVDRGLASGMEEVKLLASELLSEVDAKMGSAAFMGAFGAIQRKIQSKKAGRKAELAVEAITDPKKHALRKLEKTRSKEISRKRKNLRYAAVKGLKRPKMK